MAAMDFDTIRYYDAAAQIVQDLRTFETCHLLAELLEALRTLPAPHGQRGGRDARPNVQ